MWLKYAKHSTFSPGFEMYIIMRSLFLLVILLTALKANSQTLLDADSSQIMKEVKSRGGDLNRHSIEKNTETIGRYKKMVVWYGLPPEGNDCLMSTVFLLSFKNKCFKYYNQYWGKQLAEQEISMLKKRYTGLKQIKNEFKWINREMGFEVRLIPKKVGNMKSSSVYVVEIGKIQY